MKKRSKSLYFIILGFMLLFFLGMLYMTKRMIEKKAIAIPETILADSSNFSYQNRLEHSLLLSSQFQKEYLVETIESHGRNIAIYKDEYAGMFIDDNGFLNIGILGDLNFPIDLRAASNNVIYKNYNFSYNYLQEIMLAIEDIMLENDIFSVGIDEEINAVFVELATEESVETIIEELQDKNLYSTDAIVFEIEPSMSIETNSTAYGGESIFYRNDDNTVTRGSICINAIDNSTGRIGVLTNEHVARVNSGNPTMIYGGHVTFNSNNTVTFSDNTIIGTNGARGVRSGSVDAAFIPYESDADWCITADARYNATTFSNVRLGNDSQIVRGQPVKRIGQTTGVTLGEIRSTNVSITLDGIKITNTFRYTNAGEGGDSGGPVYYDSGENLYLIGMHFASGYVFGGGDQGYACRISNVINALNVTPITNDSFNTVPLTSGTLCLNSVNFSPVGAFNIPISIMGKSVAAIGNSAFYNQGNLSSMIIPATVTSIGTQAFENCTSLTSIEFSDNSQLSSIGNAAFFGCASLSSITIPVQVLTIGPNTFNNCYSLENIMFESDSYLSSIGNSAFENCASLSLITIPSGVTNIGYNAFSNCYAITKVKFSTNSQLTRIENAAFSGCASLEDMVLPLSLLHIGYDVFNGCNMLNYINLPSNITTICGNAFLNCNYLTIYTSHTSIPYGWHTNWNSSARPVVWGCSVTDDPSYVISFTKTTTNPTNIEATNGINNPYRSGYSFRGWNTESDYSGVQYMDLSSAPNEVLYAQWEQNACVAEGTFVTLFDGSQVAVEGLTGDEELLVWNMMNGEFDSAPILFLDSDPYRVYEIIHLYFSDGTEVEVIDEHAFWNIDLNKYVFLRADASKYIGNYFNKQIVNLNGDITYTSVQLVDVEINFKQTTAWSPVTYEHLCYYVNGMLSMPGATTGLINIFEVDSATMTVNEEMYLADIAEYGLFTYEEFVEMIAIPKEIFNAFNGQYLKVAIGKGLIDFETIATLVDRYSSFFDLDND